MDYDKLSLKEWCELCHSIAKEKGFWEKDRNIGEALMLAAAVAAELAVLAAVVDAEDVLLYTAQLIVDAREKVQYMDDNAGQVVAM